MFKTYQIYIINYFLKKFILISIVFLSLIIILGSFEEISFFKDLDVNFIYPYFMTLINSPITLYEIFPFIFLLTTQLLFYEFIKKDELNLLKTNGIKNTSFIKIIFILSVFIGLFNSTIFYNLASNLKFYYSNIKNSYSTDNKYLAMVTKSGLWIKDEVDGKKIIVNAEMIKDNFISRTTINEFSKDFNLIRIIQSEKIDIRKNNWIIYDPIITVNNITTFKKNPLILNMHFNYEKIINIFSNIFTLNFFKLFDLKKDYERLGYSSDDIYIHLLKILLSPLVCGIMTVLSSIIMIVFKKNNSIIFHIAIGFLISVIIYYFIFFFSSLGSSGKIPILVSIIFPISILSILSILGIININEK
jgi:lipopolysaccharide export system permease protein